MIITSLAKSDNVSNDDVFNIGTVMPGDMCTLLRAEGVKVNDYPVPVIVHRFWRCETGMPAIILLWVRTVEIEVSQSTTSSHNLGIQISEYHVISKLSLRRQGNNPNSKEAAPRCGELEDGTPFVCYRMMLYCDDFTKSSYSSSAGSLGGCYIMPLGYSPEQRRNTPSVRLISLTPPEVSMNEVLQFIVDDIVQGSIHGLQARTPDGIDVRVFLELVGFVGDYPAAASVIDVVGHVGRAPCSLCSFRRLHKSKAEGSTHGYTTEVHANHSGFMRMAERHQSLRDSDINGKDANVLGMIRKIRLRGKRCPLMEIHDRLEQDRALVPKKSEGTQVVPALLDPHRCNFVAPDHLLTGLAKNILNTAFLSLPRITDECELMS